MNKVFIAYGSGTYINSLHRIGEEARQLGFFSKVILYTEKDLPLYIKSSPLKAYSRGDGYWVWKPYIIWKTMQDYPDCIVVYVDCGCTLQPNMEEWNEWFSMLEIYDTLVFKYRLNYIYPWQKNNNVKSINAEWTKLSTIAYFDSLIGDKDWVNTGQCWAGVVLSCRKSAVIKMWLDLALLRPDLFMDCFGKEIVEQEDFFQEHRHDQSVLSAICAYWSDYHKVKILPETSESKSDAAVLATRRHEEEKVVNAKTQLIVLLKRVMGSRLYTAIHRIIIKNNSYKKIIFYLEHLENHDRSNK